ncbi:uncharacterized protein OCT59_010413 [Rhizophagus irregularis]|uniref:Uncharacterized protein n=1 Tax=Rhizophagus irregularis (strain DAOM 197198w) TaxID=1432141 RepID=A0A015L411_RHIIW|nr:hypothetical protein RirG_050770 [Rhizophagus irregularis DAOM 197198w]UZO19113.1 hypothetical protein OCT59_010413 [Rhizophagus irregularis]GBC30054.1 hypothetical protein RIR_jg23782.t1 [Rhizophagus irregularis DAOM 181602=DAOM 197198]CAG8436324.1 904_t:CDS:2 [Rhizophagus irregularis]
MLIHQIFLSSKAERVKPVQSSASTSVRNPSTNTMQNNVSLKQPTESPPSSGSPDISLNPSPLQIHDLASLKLLGKKMKNLVSGPPNRTYVRPMTVQRISWNQSPCQTSGHI